MKKKKSVDPKIWNDHILKRWNDIDKIADESVQSRDSGRVFTVIRDDDASFAHRRASVETCHDIARRKDPRYSVTEHSMISRDLSKQSKDTKDIQRANTREKWRTFACRKRSLPFSWNPSSVSSVQDLSRSPASHELSIRSGNIRGSMKASCGRFCANSGQFLIREKSIDSSGRDVDAVWKRKVHGTTESNRIVDTGSVYRVGQERSQTMRNVVELHIRLGDQERANESCQWRARWTVQSGCALTVISIRMRSWMSSRFDVWSKRLQIFRAAVDFWSNLRNVMGTSMVWIVKKHTRSASWTTSWRT